MAGLEQRAEIVEFLNREARLLDQHRLSEWLELFTDDAQYVVPTRDLVEGDLEEGGFAFHYMDETKSALQARIMLLESGAVPVETPPSMVRHLITNILVDDTDRPDEFAVISNFMVSQVRKLREHVWFVGTREDRLRLVDGQLRIARREVLLDQPLLPRALSIFF